MPQRLLRLMAMPAARWAMVGLHLVLLALLYRQQGILDDKEALKYIGAAEDLVRGDPDGMLGRYRLYAGYILFLLPFVALGMPKLAVVAQVVLGIMAAFALSRLAARSGAGPAMANVAAALYLLAYPIHVWTLSLYSEALFIPLVVLFMERAFRPGRWGLVAAGLALAVLVTRPTGILFVVPALLLGPLAPVRWPALPRWAGVAALVPVMLFVPVLDRGTLVAVTEAHVVGGFPEHPENAGAFEGRTLAGAQVFVAHQHGIAYWSGLVMRRMGSFLDPRRPYYSALHNALLVPVLVLHPLAVLGCWRRWRSPLVQVFLTQAALNALLIGLTYDEWNGRFLAPLLPLVILLAVSGADRLVRSMPWKAPATG